jgi:hypothetical protein
LFADFEFFGAYIPGWLASAAIGIIVSCAAWPVVRGLGIEMPFPLIAHTGFAIFISGLVWLALFR